MAFGFHLSAAMVDGLLAMLEASDVGSVRFERNGDAMIATNPATGRAVTINPEPISVFRASDLAGDAAEMRLDSFSGHMLKFSVPIFDAATLAQAARDAGLASVASVLENAWTTAKAVLEIERQLSA